MATKKIIEKKKPMPPIKQVKLAGPKQMKKPAPIKQMETIKKVYNEAKKIVSNVGNKISNANDAGQKAFEDSETPASFAGDFGGGGGGGPKRSYERNPLAYVGGFVKNIVSGDNIKTKEKSFHSALKTKEKKSPTKQLGRQAVTKMGGKKTSAAKMKKC